MTDHIVLVGEGHGGLAALRGLQQAFKRVDLVTGDSDLIDANPKGSTLEKLALSDAPLAVLAGSRRILRPEEVERRPVFNVHYSLLPAYRGLHSIVWAMLNDERTIGLTVHLVNERVDDGPILHQHAVEVEEDWSSWDMMRMFDDHVAEHLGTVLREYDEGKRELVPQKTARATWVPRRNRDDCLVNYDAPHRFLQLFFRALVQPYPLPQILCRQGRFEITRHTLLHRPYLAQNGRVVNVDEAGAYIKTAESVLIVEEARDGAGDLHAGKDILFAGERLG